MPVYYAIVDAYGAQSGLLTYQQAPAAADIPENAVELTAEQHAEWVNNPLTRAWVKGAMTTVSGPAPATRYVSMSIIRDRVNAAGKWVQFAAALDALPADKRWHLLTLAEGVASDDPDATALMTAVGCDPAVILAP